MVFLCLEDFCKGKTDGPYPYTNQKMIYTTYKLSDTLILATRYLYALHKDEKLDLKVIYCLIASIQ
jgi:hypothetical protein